jgi:anti-sigma regulatory factor (Ser/Thr protein kinase)
VSWENILADTASAYGPQGSALHLDVRPLASEVSRAREFVRTGLAGHDRAELDVITLLLSELLTNAVLHGRSRIAVDISVRVRADAVNPGGGPKLGVWALDPVTAILIGVTDASPVLPQQRPAVPLPESGLGMYIVGQLADTWGVAPLEGGGKIVWFAVNVRQHQQTGGPLETDDAARG